MHSTMRVLELIAATLEAPPEHLGCSRERRHPGEHHDCEKHSSDDIISIPFVCSNEHVARRQCTAVNLETEMPEEPRRRTLTIRRASSRRYAPRDALEPIAGELERIGGSRAQLDLVEFTLLNAYRSRRRNLAVR